MEITDLVNRVRKAIEQVGPGGAVMFDAHSCREVIQCNSTDDA